MAESPRDAPLVGAREGYNASVHHNSNNNNDNNIDPIRLS